MDFRKLFLTVILFITLLGSAFGYYFYREQLAATPIWLWPFVPDCPLYTTLFAVVLVGLLKGWRNDFLSFITAIGLIKYGLWTGFVVLWFHDYLFVGSLAALYVSLFACHVGMWLEGLTLPFRKVEKWFWPVAAGWFLLNDVVDYFGPATHPWLPGGDLTAVVIVTFALTFLTLGVVWYLAKKKWKLLPEVTIRL